MLTLSKSPFPSLPITVSSLRCNTVAQLDITHQQERQIPALRDSCFMPGITNWIVWGSIIYLNTKMQSYSPLFYEVSNSILKYTKRCVWKMEVLCKNKKMNSDTVLQRFFIGSYWKMISNAFCLCCAEDMAWCISSQHAWETWSHRLHVSFVIRREGETVIFVISWHQNRSCVLGMWYVELVLCANTEQTHNMQCCFKSAGYSYCESGWRHYSSGLCSHWHQEKVNWVFLCLSSRLNREPKAEPRVQRWDGCCFSFNTPIVTMHCYRQGMCVCASTCVWPQNLKILRNRS